MMRLVCHWLAALAAISSGSDLGAQVRQDVVGAERAAAAYVASHFATGHVFFDIAPVPYSGVAGAGPRTTAENEDIGRLIGAAKVGRANDFRVCPYAHNAECDVPGFDVVIGTSRLVIRNDSAIVAVRRFFHGIPGDRLMSVENYRIRLVKRGAVWSVDDVRTTSVS